MSKKTFRGRVVLEGKVSGTATVSRQPFNTSGSYMENMFAGRTDAAPCSDSSNNELFGKDNKTVLALAIAVVAVLIFIGVGGTLAIGLSEEALITFGFFVIMAAAVYMLGGKGGE